MYKLRIEYLIMEDKILEQRLIDIEIAIANQEKIVDELNEVIIEQSKLIDRLIKQNQYLLSVIEAEDAVKPLNEETPPPHY